ncbi:MAG: iron complex transport system substrate-binding protein [Marinobacter excellens HL-55]|uniref:Iron complex transport system substrate-binding protein n=1 Tax=Marinobacter excellens HL-55 TaxID=1305731 RepID=A0A0P7Z944_9GAMM|nr:MAG: iron complex transport system substrate-binding protein [Marinobacter excellens HL-55]
MSQHKPIKRFFTAAAALLGAMALGQACAATHSVDTAYGTVTINSEPQRVVTLYEGALDSALAVGANAIGAVITRGGNDVAEYIKPLAGDIAIVGAPAETNIEAVIAARPDIILAPAQTNQQQYQLLSRIAPVVVSNVPLFQADSWEQETRLFGRALGRDEAAETVIEDVKARIAEVAALVEKTVPEDQRDATLVRWMPQGPLVMAEGLFSVTLLQAVGFQVTDNGLVGDSRPHSQPLSLENLVRMDQNWVFLATLNADGQQALEAARQTPAFNRLKANGQDRVVAVNGQLWTSATGPLAANAILDDIETALAKLAP